MSNQIQQIEKLFAAFEAKDKELVKTMIHPDYLGIMPHMQIKGIDGIMQCLEQCPFVNHSENIIHVTEGNRTVRFWDMVVTAPLSFRVRMVELIELKDGKLYRTESLCDSNAFPKEAKALFGNCESEKGQTENSKQEKALTR